MKLRLYAFVALSISAFTLTHVAHARATGGQLLNTRQVDRAQQWVVAPGTRLVAGDPTQDEFYILSGNPAKPAVKVAENTVRVIKPVNEHKIKVALKKTLHTAAHHSKGRTHKQVAVTKSKTRSKASKKIARLKKSTHHANIAKTIKSASHSAKAKSVIRSKAKVALNQRHRAKTTSVTG